MKYVIVYSIAILLLLAGCGRVYMSSSSAPVEKGFKYVRVNFATDRKPSLVENQIEEFTGERSETIELNYGQCLVTIPTTHRIGEIEEPLFKMFEDARNHIVFQKIISITKNGFYADLSRTIDKDNKRSAFIFIHGYNVTFEEAAKRTAQIHYDLQFSGAPILYSWPSKGNVFDYTTDETNIEWTQGHLTNFLKDFFSQTKAENVYIIAHSMGNRAICRSLNSLYISMPNVKEKLKEVILAAPDIDASVFTNDIAPSLKQSAKRVTVYGSDTDVAIMASKRFHSYRRLGEGFNGFTTISGIDLIDATGIDTSLMGINHSYMSSRTVLGDIKYLITGTSVYERFGLERVNSIPVPFWKLKH